MPQKDSENIPESLNGFKNFFRSALLADKRQKSHETSTLDRERQLPLMLRANARMTRVNDLRLARNKPL